MADVKKDRTQKALINVETLFLYSPATSPGAVSNLCTDIITRLIRLQKRNNLFYFIFSFLPPHLKNEVKRRQVRDKRVSQNEDRPCWKSCTEMTKINFSEQTRNGNHADCLQSRRNLAEIAAARQSDVSKL